MNAMTWCYIASSSCLKIVLSLKRVQYIKSMITAEFIDPVCWLCTRRSSGLEKEFNLFTVVRLGNFSDEPEIFVVTFVNIDCIPHQEVESIARIKLIQRHFSLSKRFFHLLISRCFISYLVLILEDSQQLNALSYSHEHVHRKQGVVLRNNDHREP